MSEPREIKVNVIPTTQVHPAMPVPRDGRTVPIDVELAPIIAEVWRYGIGTTSCCQDQGAVQDASDPEAARWQGWAAIIFDNIIEANAFAAVVLAGFEELGETDDSDLGFWRWEIVHFAYPLGAGPVRVGIPRNQLAELAEWVAAAPHDLDVRARTRSWLSRVTSE